MASVASKGDSSPAGDGLTDFDVNTPLTHSRRDAPACSMRVGTLYPTRIPSFFDRHIFMEARNTIRL